MFKSFFLDRRWFLWSILGSALILYGTWYLVQVTVEVNGWYGSFFDLLQKAMTTPNSVSLEEILAGCFEFLNIVSVYVFVVVFLEFFTKHYVFRWRTAMNDYYTSHWDKIRHIEGASQRVQEDTMRLAAILESLGVSFLRSVMILIAFLPLLWTLSENIKELPWIGPVDHSLVYLAIIISIFGTVLLAAVGFKLPGLEFNNQKVEAAYRKELVHGEDHQERAQPETLKELYSNVRKNYFTLFKHYLYFDVARFSYIQYTVILPFIAMAPAIVSGAITFGLFQQINNSFGKVEESFQYLVHSWKTIVELMSIYKRLKAFEIQINEAIAASEITIDEQI